MRLKPTNSTCTLTSQPAEAVDYEIIPAQFRPSLEAISIFLFRLFKPGQNCILFGKDEWLRGNKKRIRILLGVVASTKNIAEQIGWAGSEGQLVFGDA